MEVYLDYSQPKVKNKMAAKNKLAAKSINLAKKSKTKWPPKKWPP